MDSHEAEITHAMIDAAFAVFAEAGVSIEDSDPDDLMRRAIAAAIAVREADR